MLLVDFRNDVRSIVTKQEVNEFSVSQALKKCKTCVRRRKKIKTLDKRQGRAPGKQNMLGLGGGWPRNS